MIAKKFRILTVDDHPMLRQWIASVLDGQPDMEVVAEAQNGVEAVEICLRLRPDVTLMDIQMPGMDGIEATEGIRKSWPEARILIVTNYKGDAQARRALEAGACGYLLKSALRHQLIETIRTIQSGKRHVPLEVAREMARNCQETALSKREIEVLSLVAFGNANRDVGSLLRITEDTVKAHMKAILLKLRANDRTHAVTLAAQRGILDLTK
jgi:DNA-binding NarL/FixJ family response regulator